MAKIDVLDILRVKKQSPLEFNFDNLWIPPIEYYLSPQDIDSLRRIATSLKLSSKIEVKYSMIDNIMRPRGFKRFSAGTNRVVYSCLEDDRFVVKIAVDRVGMQDNPMEYKNQFLLKPYCTKMFYISKCGTVGFAERVLPIKNKAEFKEIAGDVFDILINKILGKYVVEDIGSKYFMNYGIRFGNGPVLLDYPYVYELDGKKLFCNKVDPVTNQTCNGEIDYDAGFNHLVCTRCGKIYLATDLKNNDIDNKIIIKGGIQMKVVLKKGDDIIGTSIATEEVIRRPKRPEFKKTPGLVVRINGKTDDSYAKKETPSSANAEVAKTESASGEGKTTHTKDTIRLNPNTGTISGKVVPETILTDIANDVVTTNHAEVPEIVSTDTANDTTMGHSEMHNEEDPGIILADRVPDEKETGANLATASEDLGGELDSAYDAYASYEPIRRKPKQKRDSNGRFISTNEGKSTKKKSNKSSAFIPSGKNVNNRGEV